MNDLDIIGFFQGHAWGILTFTLHEAASWIIRIAALCVVPLRHEPSTATVWLLVIFFWPIPGAIIYLLMGSRMLPKKKLERRHTMLAHLKGIRDRITRETPGAVHPEVSDTLKPTVRLAEGLGHMTIVGGNDCTPITDAIVMLDMLAADIEEAVSEVNLLYYIFVKDEKTWCVVDALKRAAARGVICRLLVDSVGSSAFIKKHAQEFRDAGIRLEEALPVQLFRRKAARFDLRNHRKLAVIDRKTAYTGSHNITDPRYGHRNLVWHDISLRLRGPIVRQLESVFLEDWYSETGEMMDAEHLFGELELPGGSVMQTVPSGPSYVTENYQRLIVASIIGAREQVTITTPYLIPDAGLIQALEVACLRGVRVRLIVPEKSDQFVVGHAARAYFGDLLRIGVELYLYQDGLLHAKTMSVDGELTFLGSSNFDIRSFALNFEINLILYGRQENASLLQAQEDYRSRSRLLVLEEWQGRPRWMPPVESVTKLFSPLL